MANYQACFHVRDRNEAGLGYVYLRIDAPTEVAAQEIAEILGERLRIDFQCLEPSSSS